MGDTLALSIETLGFHFNQDSVALSVISGVHVFPSTCWAKAPVSRESIWEDEASRPILNTSVFV